MRRLSLAAALAGAAWVILALGLTATAPAAEFGQCRELTTTSTPKANHGKYVDAGCIHKLKKVKGNFEWYAAPGTGCVKQKGGEYADAACTTKAKKLKKGKYERQPCYGEVNTCNEFTAVSSVQHNGGLECAGGSAAGRVTGAKAATVTEIGEGCHIGESTCNSVEPEEPPGNIAGVGPFEATLLGEGDVSIGGGEPGEEEVWLQTANQHGIDAPGTYRWVCDPVGYIENRGYSVAQITPINTMSSTFEIDEEPSEEQLLEAYSCDSTFTACSFTGDGMGLRRVYLTPSEPGEIRQLEPPEEREGGGEG